MLPAGGHAVRRRRPSGGARPDGRRQAACSPSGKSSRQPSPPRADGPGAVMRRATTQSLAQVARCVTRLDRAGLHASAPQLTAAIGQVAVRDAISRYREDELVPAEHAAWLTVALGQMRVRDDAWARMDARAPGRAPAALDRPDPAGAARLRGRTSVAASLLSPGRQATERWPTSPLTVPSRTTARYSMALLLRRGSRLGCAAFDGAPADDPGRGRRRLRRRGSR